MNTVANSYLREATIDDMDLLFEWVNDASVRSNSMNTDIISYREHKEWFEDVLSRNDVIQYIYVCNGEDVGQIRISISGEDAEIGYSISSKHRGKGYGEALLGLLKEKVKEKFPDIKRLTAKVKLHNEASLRSFLASGYKQYERCTEKKSQICTFHMELR